MKTTTPVPTLLSWPVTTNHEIPALQNTPVVDCAAGRSYRDQVVKDEVQADSSQQVIGYGVELAILYHHGLQQGGLPSVTTRGFVSKEQNVARNNMGRIGKK